MTTSLANEVHQLREEQHRLGKRIEHVEQQLGDQGNRLSVVGDRLDAQDAVAADLRRSMDAHMARLWNGLEGVASDVRYLRSQVDQTALSRDPTGEDTDTQVGAGVLALLRSSELRLLIAVVLSSVAAQTCAHVAGTEAVVEPAVRDAVHSVTGPHQPEPTE